MTPVAAISSLLTPARWPLIGALGSGALLAGAFGFEYIGRYPPCPLCLNQRWVHAAALGFGLLAFIGMQMSGDIRRLARLACWLLGLIFLYSVWAALQHAGIEYGWWPGPASCTASGIGSLTLDDLNAALGRRQNVVLCDEVAWSMLGVSMAGWNAIVSAALALISFGVAFRHSEQNA